MEDFVATCGCGAILRGRFLSPISLCCQQCGKTTGILTTRGNIEGNALIFQCLKCKEEFAVKIGIDALLKCPNRKCGNAAIKPLRAIYISKVTTLEPPPEIEVKPTFISPSVVNLRVKRNTKIKIAIPYFEGGLRIERAIKTWMYPEIAFIISDRKIIPPGHGICSQIFTSENGEEKGITKEKRPFIIDILSKLLNDFPDCEYYGYFNSDVILPPGTSIESLLPNKGKDIVFHHRMEFDGKDTDPIWALQRKYQVYCGKDGFIGKKSIIKSIVDSINDMIIGSAAWDDGLAVWCFNQIGFEKVELRYGDIYHVYHPVTWTCDDKGSRFNLNQLEKSGIPTAVRCSFNWFKVMNEEDVEDKAKRINYLGIIQPGRIGDIIIVLPIAKWYFDRGYRVVWPVISEYLPLFEYVPYVEAVDIGPNSGSYKKSRQILEERGITEVIDLGIGFGRNESDWVKSKLSFDEWKYHEAKVPFKERFNLHIIRNLQKEMHFQHKLNIYNQEDYIVTHSKCSNGEVMDWGKEGIEICPVDGFTLFDWIGIIERAKWVYCCDSSVAHLVDKLNLAKGHRTFQLWSNKHYRALCKSTIDWSKDGLIPRGTEMIIKEAKSGGKKRLLDTGFYSGKYPLHFFTIVLNGMPFIRYHIKLFKSLPFKWHWHIVEGMADLKYDTQWQLAHGGQASPDYHNNNLSIDGTTEYLNCLKKEFPDNISLYRKKGGQLWEGKVEMCNSFIPNLPSSCILWQVDDDEFWDYNSIFQMLKLFEDNPNKFGAYVYCYYFVGPKRYLTTMDNWGTRATDWFRIFRFREGFYWSKHEPPTLVDKNAIDWCREKSFTREETLLKGIVFQHFAYSDPNRVAFKQSYYGYKDVFESWNKLQKAKGEVDVFDYFYWATKGTMSKIWNEEETGEKILFPGEWML